MRITIINRYFWPESVLVNDISRWLADDGHDVEVLTGQPDYNPEVGLASHTDEIWNGVKIRRILPFRSSGRGLARNFGSLIYVILSSLIILFGRKRDAVWLTSIPPIVQPLLIRIVTKLRGVRLVYFPQDIYPEIALSSNLMRDGLMARWLREIDSWVIRSSDVVVTISHDMANYLHIRARLNKAPSVIRSFSPVSKARPEVSNSKSIPRPLRFVFAGNIGRFQNLDALIEAFDDMNEEQVVLELLGSGREKSRLQKIVSERKVKSVRFFDFLPVEQAFDFVAQCHVGVVSLRPGIFRYAFPAKTYSYIGAGLPLLVFVEAESELTKIVKDRGLGVAISWDASRETIAAGIKEVEARYLVYRENMYKNSDDLYLPDLARKQWLDVFSNLKQS